MANYISNSAKLKKYLKIDYSTQGDIGLTSENTLRKLVGILGMGLPILLFLFLFIDSGYHTPLESISHYYYTRVSGIFVLVMSLMAIFLLIYKGEAPADFYVSSIAGLFALVVVFFPTSNITDSCGLAIPKKVIVTILNPCGFRESFHLISAGIFLACLTGMSFFLFPYKDRNQIRVEKRKLPIAWVFKLLSIVMALALLVVLAGRFNLIDACFYKTYHLTFWMETLAVESFGISWLLKGSTG